LFPHFQPFQVHTHTKKITLASHPTFWGFIAKNLNVFFLSSLGKAWDEHASGLNKAVKKGLAYLFGEENGSFVRGLNMMLADKMGVRAYHIFLFLIIN
jgi:hypothetical protein